MISLYQFFDQGAMWVIFLIYICVYEWFQTRKRQVKKHVHHYDLLFYSFVSLVVVLDLMYYRWYECNPFTTLEWLCLFHYFTVDGWVTWSESNTEILIHHICGLVILIFSFGLNSFVWIIKLGAMMEWSNLFLRSSMLQLFGMEIVWQILFFLFFAFRLLYLIPQFWMALWIIPFTWHTIPIILCASGLCLLHIRWCFLFYQKGKYILSKQKNQILSNSKDENIETHLTEQLYRLYSFFSNKLFKSKCKKTKGSFYTNNKTEWKKKFLQI